MIDINKYAFLSIVEFSAIFLSIMYLQKIKLNGRFILACCIISMIALIAFINFSQWLAILIVFAIIISLLKLNGSSFLKIMFDISFIIFIGMISDHLAQLLTFSNINSPSDTIIHILLFIIFYIVLFSVSHYIINKKNNFSLNIIVASKVFIAILIFITIIFLYLNIFMSETNTNKKMLQYNLILQIVYFFITLVIINIFKLNSQKEERLKYEKIQREHFHQYMRSLELINQDMRKFQHDYMNILFTIRSYLEENEIDDLKKYFYETILITEKNTLLKNSLTSDLKNLGIIELKGILITRFIMALNENINIHIEIPKKIDEIPMDIIHLSRVVGILIDNAIEGSLNSKEKFTRLAILETQHNSILLVIENSFENEGLNIKDMYTSFVSTKGGNHGIGLMNLLEIIKKYPHISINTHIENNIFIQAVEFMKER